MPFFPSALFIRGCGSSNGRRQPHWDSPSVTEEHAETASGHLSSPQRTAAWRRRWSFGYFSWMCQPLVSRWLTDWLIGFFTVFRRRGRDNMCNRWAGEGCSPYDGLPTPPSAFPIRSVSTQEDAGWGCHFPGENRRQANTAGMSATSASAELGFSRRMTADFKLTSFLLRIFRYVCFKIFRRPQHSFEYFPTIHSADCKF